MTRHEEAAARLEARAAMEFGLSLAARVDRLRDDHETRSDALSAAEQAERNARCTDPACSLCPPAAAKEKP